MPVDLGHAFSIGWLCQKAFQNRFDLMCEVGKALPRFLSGLSHNSPNFQLFCFPSLAGQPKTNRESTRGKLCRSAADVCVSQNTAMEPCPSRDQIGKLKHFPSSPGWHHLTQIAYDDDHHHDLWIKLFIYSSSFFCVRHCRFVQRRRERQSRWYHRHLHAMFCSLLTFFLRHDDVRSRTDHITT